MKITVRVKPGSRKEGVETASDGTLIIKVRAQAMEGQANEAIIEVLATHYGVPRSRITIIRGKSSRVKIIEIAK